MDPNVPNRARHALFALALLVAVACLPSGVLAASDQGSATATGADRDARGCIGSAGYTWSQLRQACVRPFEAGVPLDNVEDPGATSVAYVISSGSTEPLELFLPAHGAGILMFFRDGVWRDDDGRYTLTNSADDVLEVRDGAGKLLFSSRKPSAKSD